jgi:hypothetical protein
VLLQSGAIGLGHGDAGAPGEELSFVETISFFLSTSIRAYRQKVELGVNPDK